MNAEADDDGTVLYSDEEGALTRTNQFALYEAVVRAMEAAENGETRLVIGYAALAYEASTVDGVSPGQYISNMLFIAKAFIGIGLLRSARDLTSRVLRVLSDGNLDAGTLSEVRLIRKNINLKGLMHHLVLRKLVEGDRATPRGKVYQFIYQDASEDVCQRIFHFAGVVDAGGTDVINRAREMVRL